MRFHILGIGSIGSLLAHHLRRAVPAMHHITLIHKTLGQARDALLEGGTIRVETNGITTKATGFKSEIFEGPNVRLVDSTWVSGGPDYNIDSLFVTTKAHETLPAIRRLLPRISPNSTIVLLQNGMGIYEELAEKLFYDPARRPHFILATNTHGAYLKRFYNVVHAGVGTIEFGIMPNPGGRDFEKRFKDETVERSDRQPRISDITNPRDAEYLRYKSLQDTVAALSLLDTLHVSWRPMSEIHQAMRRKLAVNAVINPLTALMGCRNGDVFSSPPAHRIMRRVCSEASSAFAGQIMAETKAWLAELSSQGIDADEVDIGTIPYGLSAMSLEEEVLRVAEATKGNISSMLSDIRRGRKTEIDYINGYLLKLGSSHRVEMPANATLCNLIKMRSEIPLDQML